jgi:hypothetical protein
MALDTATILDSIADRIESLTPATQLSASDRYSARIAPFAGVHVAGRRAVTVSGEGGIRKPTGGSTCSDWETTVSILVAYPLTHAANGTERRGAYSDAIQDSEDILSDLYYWSTTTVGILQIDPQPATVDDNGDGVIESERSIFIRFKRS